MNNYSSYKKISYAYNIGTDMCPTELKKALNVIYIKYIFKHHKSN